MTPDLFDLVQRVRPAQIIPRGHIAAYGAVPSDLQELALGAGASAIAHLPWPLQDADAKSPTSGVAIPVAGASGRETGGRQCGEGHGRAARSEVRDQPQGQTDAVRGGADHGSGAGPLFLEPPGSSVARERDDTPPDTQGAAATLDREGSIA